MNGFRNFAARMLRISIVRESISGVCYELHTFHPGASRRESVWRCRHVYVRKLKLHSAVHLNFDICRYASDMPLRSLEDLNL